MITKSKYERAQALIFIALGIIGMVAMVGLAVDGGHAFFDRRRAQNAADTAALNGAIVKTQEERDVLFGVQSPISEDDLRAWITLAAKNMASANGYNDNKSSPGNTVDVYWPPDDGPYAGDKDYVQVVITSHISTYFAKVIGVDQMHNRVEAVALATSPTLKELFGGYAFASLKPGSGTDGTGTNCLSGEFIVGGTANIYVDGGIFTNSKSACAFEQAGCNVLLTVVNGSIDAGGLISTDDCSPLVPGDRIDAVENPNVPQITVPDPDMELPAPAECNTPGFYEESLIENTTKVHPGSYGNFPPTLPGTKFVEMMPGIYCVNRLDFTTAVVPRNPNQNTFFSDGGVFIYIRPGGTFNISGGLTSLTGYDNPFSIYNNYLIYAAPDYSKQPPGCKIGGGGASTFTGTILAPYCDVTISGNSTPEGYTIQVIGWTVKVDGDAYLKFIYNEDDAGRTYVRPKTGLYR